jgi:diguanylate cyclase (GGDEF)-like protein/PAS domain S-box-containing protein
MTLDLIYSTALLLALSALYEFNVRIWGSRHLAAGLAAGLIFGAISIFGMMHPANLAPGVIFDGRSAILGVAGIFAGLPAAMIAGLMAAAYRLWLGGAGAPVGVAVIATSVLFGLAMRRALHRGWAQPKLLDFMMFGLLLHIACLGWFLLLPLQHLQKLLDTVAVPYLFVLAPSTALLALLLNDLQMQRRSKEALTRSEALRRAITRASPDLLLVLDEDGRYLEVISQEEQLLSGRPDQLIGKRVDEVLSADEAQRLHGFLRQTIQAGAPQRIEYEMDGMDGRHVLEGRAQVLDVLVDGKRAVLFVSRDITERVAAEQDRRIAAVAFESRQAMLVSDADTVILQANQAFVDLLGYSREELIGRKTSMLRSGRQDAAFYEAMWDSIQKTGKWEGEIWDQHKHGELILLWTTITAVRNEHRTVTHYVATMSDFSERKVQEEKIRAIAFYDPLTALPNRRLLLERLQRALTLARRNGQHGALLFLDVDNFKGINDAHGHHTGDLLLQEIADRLGRVVRESDTVARLGGDEFVIVLEHLNEDPALARTEARQIAAKALLAMAKPYDLDGRICRSSGSIGIALFNQTEIDMDLLMRQADEAMYQAKRAGKNTVHLHEG